MLFVGVSILFSYLKQWVDKGGGKLCYERSLILYIHDKHNTILASISELGHDSLFSSSGKWKSQEEKPMSDIFFSFRLISVITSHYYYFSLSGALFVGLLCLGVLSFQFPFSFSFFKSVGGKG